MEHVLEILIKRERNDVILPTKAHDLDAGFDIYWSGPFDNYMLDPGQIVDFQCGFSTAIPSGFFAMVKDRSGNALNQHFHVLAGVIDSNFRGEWRIVLANLGKNTIRINRNAKIAQFVVLPVLSVGFKETVTLPESDRGVAGFGSSGS